MSNKKILIIHDRFQYKGGGERLVLIMARALHADIATEYWDEKNSFSMTEAPAKIITLGAPVRIRGLGYLSAQWRFFWRTKFVKDYDTVIFSGNNCLSAAWRLNNVIPAKAGIQKKNDVDSRLRGNDKIKKIMYCHHPVRFAFDLKDYYYRRYAPWQRPLFVGMVWLARRVYGWGIKKMDVVMANSENVKSRLQNLVGRQNAVVVYPPIDTEKFQHTLSFPPRVKARDKLRRESRNDYYLSFARLVDLKRVSDIARAFRKMPDKKLIVASGGPELEKIQRLAHGFANIKIKGFVSDEELVGLVGNCIATIYIPIDEDFGMSPLEAASAGKPTIGVDDGGLRETIIHKKTGYLIPKDYKIDDLISAVNWLTPERAVAFAGDCKRQAEKFSKEKFVNRVKKMV